MKYIAENKIKNAKKKLYSCRRLVPIPVGIAYSAPWTTKLVGRESCPYPAVSPSPKTSSLSFRIREFALYASLYTLDGWVAQCL